ncbi:MAG TPA: hypothetical protein VHO72_18055 [Bacteroidales bacterium]|nr:hypothetical protein [Bacteroidales bacterium]
MTSLKNILVVFFLSAHMAAFCQNEPGLKLVTRAEDFKLQERVLLIADQDFYLAGETLNFFAMTMDAGLQIPVAFSSILYLELYDQNNTVVVAKKVLLKKGEAINTLDLPRQTKTGYYYIRAYTNYMKNFGPSAFFTKRLKIVNPFFPNNYSLIGVPSQELRWGYSVEGGNLLYNTDNRIVFYSLNAGEKLFVKLYKNDVVAIQSETKNGMGSFSFIPEEGNKYAIEAISDHGKTERTDLKSISNTGVTCKLDSILNNTCFVTIHSANFTQFPLSVFVENNGSEYMYATPVNDSAAFLSMKLLPGLNRITIKDTEQHIVSHRLVYIKPEASLSIAAHFNKTEASRSDSIVLNLQSLTSDTIQYLVALHLGNEHTLPSLQEHIEAALYTSSIALFTNHVAEDELRDLGNDWKQMNDYILRFQHSTVTDNPLKHISYLPEFTHDFVTGSVKANNNVSAANKNLYLSFVDSISWINRSKTDTFGKFTAALPIDYQGKDLVISMVDTTNDYTILCDDEFYPDFLKVTKEDYYPDSSLKPIIEARMINLQVNDAYADVNKTSINADRPLLRFYGYPDTEYKFSKYTSLPNLEEFITEVVKEALVRKRGSQVSFKVITGRNDMGNARPLIIFDGIPLLQTDHLSPLISTEKLKSVQVVSSRFFFGPEVFDGILDITSNDKSFTLVEKDKNSVRVRFSPVITTTDVNNVANIRTPQYVSDLYFGKINSAAGKESVRITLPQNAGSYSLSLFGYTKNGEWGYMVLPDQLIVK